MSDKAWGAAAWWVATILKWAVWAAVAFVVLLLIAYAIGFGV